MRHGYTTIPAPLNKQHYTLIDKHMLTEPQRKELSIKITNELERLQNNEMIKSIQNVLFVLVTCFRHITLTPMYQIANEHVISNNMVF